MFSKFSKDLTSRLIIVKSCPTGSFCFYDQNMSKILPNLFHVLLNTINKKTDLPGGKKKKLKAVKDRGWGGSRVGMTPVKDLMVFLRLPLEANKCGPVIRL